MASLERDYTVVPGQNFACLSVVGPDRPQRSDEFGIKIRGCFNSRDEAAKHAERLQKEDATFDIYVVDMFQWLVIPPRTEEIQDTHYAENKLEEMMQAYHENQSQARKLFEERKRDMMAKPLPGANDMKFIKGGDENSKYYTKPDEAPLSHPADVLEELKKEFPDKPLEELVKMADEKVAEEVKGRQERRDAEVLASAGEDDGAGPSTSDAKGKEKVQEE